MIPQKLLKLSRVSRDRGDGVDYSSWWEGPDIGRWWVFAHFSKDRLNEIGVLRSDYTFVHNYKIEWIQNEHPELYIVYEDGTRERMTDPKEGTWKFLLYKKG